MNMKDKNKTPKESLVRIFINGEYFSGLLCTPADVKELAMGWLFNQGLIDSTNDIASLGACEDMMDVQVQFSNGKSPRKDRELFIKTSACMGGEISLEHFMKDRPKLSDTLTISLSALKSLMKKTLSGASAYRETGGVHVAAIASATEKKIIACFEDVGRHNAVDKAVGRMLLTGQAPDDKILLTSGRISSEMALKAANARIPVLVSITTCTDLAVRIAKGLDLTIVGRMLNTSPIVWCGDHRIKIRK